MEADYGRINVIMEQNDGKLGNWERKLLCARCGEDYTEITSLKTHLIKAHMEIKKSRDVDCPYCTYKTSKI